MTHPKILEIANKVTAKRPKTVIDHIIEYGSIDNEILKETYGYNHPPRAIRDVRETGIPIITEKTTGTDGRRIAKYRFGDPDKIENFKIGGRQTFSKKFKEDLVNFYGSIDTVTGISYEARYLQIDHRIPFEIAGDSLGDEQTIEKFMLLSGASQRQKSWSCENCVNFKENKSLETCSTCYWASPEDYDHIALRHIKSHTLIFEKSNFEMFEKLNNICANEGTDMNTKILSLIRDHLVNAGER